MKTILLAASAVFFMLCPVFAQDAGECLSEVEAQAEIDAGLGEIAGFIDRPPGILVLIKRTDGTFKEVIYFPLLGRVCHVQDFIGDPRIKSMSM